MNCSWYSIMNCALRLTSRNSVYARLMSSTSTAAAFRLVATSEAAVIK